MSFVKAKYQFDEYITQKSKNGPNFQNKSSLSREREKKRRV